MGAAKNRARETRVTRVRPAGPDHQVVTVTVEGPHAGHCAQPCRACPWRRDRVGEFPPEAFRHSAETAYDMAQETFACHVAGSAWPKLCAGFLLRGADHNLSIRLKRIRGEIGPLSDGGHDLHPSYREMAVANGVDPADPALAPCR